MKFLINHFVFLVASMKALYSNSMEDRTMEPCFLLLRVMGMESNIKIYPLVDFRVSMSHPQSTSLNLVSCNFSFFKKKKLALTTPLRYCKIAFVVTRWASYGFCMYSFARFITNEKFGQMFVRKINFPTKL